MEKNSKLILSTLVVLVIIIGIAFFFKKNTYKINFYNDNTIIKTIETRKNKTIEQPEKPTKEGFIFIGWYQNDGEVFNFENPINQDTNLYARWATIVTNE